VFDFPSPQECTTFGMREIIFKSNFFPFFQWEPSNAGNATVITIKDVVTRSMEILQLLWIVIRSNTRCSSYPSKIMEVHTLPQSVEKLIKQQMKLLG
jgi:hypothetical protein